MTPAARGGESLLVDGARLLARLERDEPTFANALFEVDRVQRFYFGDVAGPTVALRGGHLTWTCSPIGLPGGDGVASTLAQLLRSEQIIQHQLRPGDALVASNHRMLHGRRAFEGDRELVRLLVWLERPLPAAPLHVARARELSPPADASTLMRLRAVLAILRGVPPAKVASDLRIPEATLYVWRDTFTRAGVQSLARARGA